MDYAKNNNKYLTRANNPKRKIYMLNIYYMSINILSRLFNISHFWRLNALRAMLRRSDYVINPDSRESTPFDY